MARRKRLFPSLRSIADRILQRPYKTAPGQDAAVLAIVDPLKRILVCKRAEHLNSFPGEACLPGFKWESGDTCHADTAKREAEEEVGINRSLVSVQYELSPLRVRNNVKIFAVVGTVAEEPHLAINTDEVADTMWMPLESFLKKKFHWHLIFDKFDVHGFDFPQFEVYGLTADLCILIAIKELGQAPEFDISENLTAEIMADMSPTEIIDKFYEDYYVKVRNVERKMKKTSKL